jgi:hypothetical protein
MAKIFWVVCPQCARRFYASKDDFRHKERPMLCPFCGNRFIDQQAGEIIEDQS